MVLVVFYSILSIPGPCVRVKSVKAYFETNAFDQGTCLGHKDTFVVNLMLLNTNVFVWEMVGCAASGTGMIVVRFLLSGIVAVFFFYGKVEGCSMVVCDVQFCGWGKSIGIERRKTLC
jgi:hypothetical protein